MTDRQQQFPANWQIGHDFDPNDHLMQLKGRDYLNVQSRLLWFIRDQRALIVAGLATMPYVVRSELVEMDRTNNWAHYKTYVRDVLGNEATMYGSESAKSFADYAEIMWNTRESLPASSFGSQSQYMNVPRSERVSRACKQCRI